MSLFTSRGMAAFAAAAAMALAAPAALAQEPPQPQQPPAQTPGFDQPAATPDLAEEDLQRFALAAIQVERINQIYAPQLQQAESPDQQQLIRQQANQAAAQAVAETGLSVEQYNDIARSAVQNPEVAARINQHIEQALPQQPEPQPQQ